MAVITSGAVVGVPAGGAEGVADGSEGGREDSGEDGAGGGGEGSGETVADTLGAAVRASGDGDGDGPGRGWRSPAPTGDRPFLKAVEGPGVKTTRAPAGTTVGCFVPWPFTPPVTGLVAKTAGDGAG